MTVLRPSGNFLHGSRRNARLIEETELKPPYSPGMDTATFALAEIPLIEGTELKQTEQAIN